HLWTWRAVEYRDRVFLFRLAERSLWLASDIHAVGRSRLATGRAGLVHVARSEARRREARRSSLASDSADRCSAVQGNVRDPVGQCDVSPLAVVPLGHVLLQLRNLRLASGICDAELQPDQRRARYVAGTHLWTGGNHRRIRRWPSRFSSRREQRGLATEGDGRRNR